MINPMEVDEEGEQIHKNSQEENQHFILWTWRNKAMKANQRNIQSSKAKTPKIDVKKRL